MAAWLLAAFLSAQTLDTATTAWRLSHGGYVEANRVLPVSTRGIVSVKAGLTGVSAVALWRARRTHPKVVAWAFIAGAISGGYASFHNLRVKP